MTVATYILQLNRCQTRIKLAMVTEPIMLIIADIAKRPPEINTGRPSPAEMMRLPFIYLANYSR